MTDIFNSLGKVKGAKLVKFEFSIFGLGFLFFLVAVVYFGFSVFQAMNVSHEGTRKQIANHQKITQQPIFISGQNNSKTVTSTPLTAKDIPLNFESSRDDIFNLLCENGRAGEALMFYEGAKSSSLGEVSFLDKTMRKVAQEKLSFMSYWKSLSEKERVDLYHKNRMANCTKLSIIVENNQTIDLSDYIELLPRLIQPIFVHNLLLKTQDKIESFYFQKRLPFEAYSQAKLFKLKNRLDYSSYVTQEMNDFVENVIVKPLVNAFLITQEYYGRSSQAWLKPFLAEPFWGIHSMSSYDDLKGCWLGLPEWCKFQIKRNLVTVNSNRLNIGGFNKLIFTTNLNEQLLDKTLLEMVRCHPLWLDALQKFKYSLAVRHLPLIFENLGFKNRQEQLIQQIKSDLLAEEKALNKRFAWGYYAKVLMLSELYPPHLSGKKNSQKQEKLYWEDVPAWIFYSLLRYKKQFKIADVFGRNRSLLEIK